MSDLPPRTVLCACLSIALAGAPGCSGKTLAIGSDAGAAGKGTSDDAGGANGGAPGGTAGAGAGGANGGASGGTAGAGAGAGAGSAGECEGEELALRQFLGANKACRDDSDCQIQGAGCGVTEDDCTGAVYVNQSTDTSELDRLTRAFARCVSGGASEGCGGCLRATSGAACLSGLCQNSRDAPLESVRIVRGEPGQTYWDLTVRGADLEEYEGKRVRVRLGSPERPPERLGSGGTGIESGAFELAFPSVWEADLYKQKFVLIDVDGDGSCDPEHDKVFTDARGSNAPELIVREPAGAMLFDFRAALDPAKACAVFNSTWPEE